ncbi:hypothetical protein NLI96_g7829 [Meripilus lineatus]|uniref:Uncharacterized protein n=1 Tax=Meripilus lineatus TaxID=2056292 RepID=A0AAD5YCK9_9APHY|nr:hypothetical protein NLI96_g7829 [Physisporinus lineatus]
MNETQANRKKEAEEVIASGSDEDALKFFEQMQDLMKSQDTLPYEFTMGLDEIIKSCGVPDLSDPLGMSSAGLSGEDSSQGAAASSSLDGLEYFDFSSFGALDDDHESKAATPDLVPTSSTNPSPSSGSEADAAHGSSSTAHLSHGSSSVTNGASSAVADVAKVVDPMRTEEDPFDPTRLGTFQEVDGGESAYYADFGNWKWDGPMGGPESGWAFLST